MKTRGNPSGPGVIKKPHLQRPDIRMQPESCHHAQDPFAQGLGPYTEILIAEDSPDNRLVIAAYLRNEPYQVDFAENGKEAIEKFTSHQYDLVFMDIQMP